MVSSGQSKIGKLDLVPSLGDQDVLWLEIAVVDTVSVAVGDGIQDLEENILCCLVISDITAVLGDVQEEISLWAVFHNDVGAILVVEDSQKGNNVWVCRDLVMQAHLSVLEVLLSCVQWESIRGKLVQYLDGILDAGENILGKVDNTIGSGSQGAKEL